MAPPNRFKGNALAEILWLRPCPQRILAVTDGSLSFDTDGFGLSEFIQILGDAGHTVSTAHRSGGSGASIAGAFRFDTAAVAVSTSNYDQIWLFGFSTLPLDAAEQTTIAKFMKSGGGVFATGDHETIGAGMGSNIPRARQMRNWSGVPMFDPERHDTVINPGVDAIKQFDDQADYIAQPLYPIFFSSGGPMSVASTWSVHPILRHRSGAVDCLPDHAHESECLAPVPVAGDFAGVEEWPEPVGGGARVAPVLVGVTVSAGRFITDTGKPPVRPHSFGAISAYDGDPARVGRVVCDATWHHFVNINLNGSGAIADTTGTPREGLYLGGSPTQEYEKIRTYYLNTVRWLAPRSRRSCFPFLQVALARVDFEMLEVDLPRPHPCPWNPLLRIGELTAQVLERHWGPGMVEEVVHEVLSSAEKPSALARLLTLDQTKRDPEKDPATLVPLAELRLAIVGSLVNCVAHRMPTDKRKLAEVLERGHEKLAATVISEALKNAELAIVDRLELAVKSTSALVKTLRRD